MRQVHRNRAGTSGIPCRSEAYCTVSVSVAVAAITPGPEAEMVRVETTGVGGGVELLLPPPPHPPTDPSSAADARTTMATVGHLRHRKMPGMRNTAASARIPREDARAALADAPAVCTETLTAVAPLAAVTVTGEGTVQVSPAGAPEHESVIVPE